MSEPQLEQFAETIEVPLEPLPRPKGLSAAGQQDLWRELQREPLRRYTQPDGPVLGAEKLKEQGLHTRPGRATAARPPLSRA